MSFKLHPGVSWHWILFGFLLGCAILWLTYQKLCENHGRRLAKILLILKTSALAMLLFGLWHPVLTYTREDSNRSRLVVLLDDSASMATRDMPGGRSRTDMLKKIWYQTIAPGLGRRLKTQVFRYGARTEPLEDKAALQAGDAFTDLAGAMRRAVDVVGRQNVGALLILGDGEHTGGGSLPELDVPVFTVGVGSNLQNINDLRMEALDIPQVISAGTEAMVQLRIAASGDGEFLSRCGKIRFSVMEGDVPVYEKNLDLSGAQTSILSFQLKPEGRGLHRYQFMLSSLEGETSHLNNRREVLLQVKDEKLRILFFSTRLSSEFKPIRQELGRDPQVDFLSVIQVSPDRYNVIGRAKDVDLSKGFPEQPQALKGFDCIILGAFPANDLALTQHRAMEQYVREGGNLVLLGGEDAFALGGWHRSPIAGLSPIIFQPAREKYIVGRFPVRVTAEGATHPAMLGLQAYLAAGEDLAPLKGVNRTGQLRPGASVLMETQLLGGERIPLVALQQFGRGKTMLIASNTLADWWTRGGVSAQVFGKLWRQSVRFVTGLEGEGSRITIAADRAMYEPHTSARLSVTIKDRSGNPQKSARLEGELMNIQGRRVKVLDFQEIEGRTGVFQAQVALPGQGGYRVSVEAWEKKDRIGSREIFLPVGLEKNEGAELALNDHRLRALAAATGGTYALYRDAELLLQRIREDIVPRETTVEISLVWDSPVAVLPSPWFLIFAILVGAEWVVRRRQNMI